MTERKYFVFRFSGVVVRERELQVLRDGQVLTVEPRAFRTLLYLLRKPNQLLSKEEIQNAVWGETAVSDNSLTRAVSMLRKILDDDPHEPRYIETVSTIGYRFISKVESIEEASGEGGIEGRLKGKNEIEFTNASSITDTRSNDGDSAAIRRIPRLWILLGGFSTVAAVVSAALYLTRPLPAPRITDSLQLTRDGRIKYLTGSDGANLYLNLFNSYVYTPALAPTAGGQITPLAIDLPDRKDPDFTMGFVQGGVSPDGTRILVESPTTWASQFDLWVVGTSGHPVRYLANVWAAAWSPDSRQVVYSVENGALFTIPSDGGTPHLLLPSPKPDATSVPTEYLSWSPDGRRIRFTRTLEHRIWEVSGDGSNLHRVFPGWDESHLACCGHWTPDGDFYIFQVGTRFSTGVPNEQLWALDERHRGLRSPIKQPIPLTTGPMAWDDAIPSRDGKRILAVGKTLLGELDRFDKKSNQLQPYLKGISAEYVDFSKDGKYLAYVSFPEGILWRCNRDGSGLTQLTSPPIHPVVIQWSPDGQQIVFEATAPNGGYAIYTVSSQGGTPTRLIPEDSNPERNATWSPDGKSVVYSTDFQRGGYASPSGLETRIFNLDNRKIVALPPGPEPGWSPRISPDGRYIVFLGLPYTAAPMIFDLQTQRYSIVHGLPAHKTLNFDLWSHDSKFLYFVLESGTNDASGVYRLPAAGGKAERVIDLNGFRQIGWLGLWMGLDPDDAPLLLRDIGNQEIYSLTLERK